ncbi:Endonuclease, Uma2 family (restriction endonuclease fold) [Actinomadura madurae]|uniref:Endonuclease, Uma2 family (Restriction endonuclease fold) n=1 Tax=Actinomadura madurae TaxID=1993 RepID=A0A1I5FL00_9ACTN|nr:Uma2 family endonuclease [Actinomadura madurae]SFO24289.1 Endonuclease, Uma2 family (restriction endonuclease fold) [Actinomadura madurae]
MPLPVWATDPSSLSITEEEYEALPSEVCKSIEVVNGSVVFCESPSLEHQVVSRNLTFALLAARPPSPCINVVQDLDMRYRYSNPHASQRRDRKRFTVRRPDISVLHCIDRGAKLWSDDVITAVEITSSDDDSDFTDKRAEYALQRIPAYLIVVMDDGRIGAIEEHRLDWSGRNYQLVAVHRGSLETELPEGMKLNVSFSELESV